jgi:hypothetical protein
VRGDPLTTRARHWTRWRRRRAGEAWAHRVHADPLRDEARAAWICSWQRSGSTLLAEVLASGPGTRLVYEPANVPDALFDGEAAARVALPRGPGPELTSIERALRGRVHGRWVDQLATGHVFRRRVVKDVRAVGLLGLVAARHPRTPLIVLVRHPLAVARSVVDLGWSAAGNGDDALLDEVRRWTELHAAALAAPTASRALVVAYEHLVLDADATLDRVLGHLGAHHPTWRSLRVDRGRLAAPSATSFRREGARTARDWVGTFDGLRPAVVDEAARLVAGGGLGGLYGTTPEPLVGVADVDAAARSRGAPGAAARRG